MEFPRNSEKPGNQMETFLGIPGFHEFLKWAEFHV
jgi:hypothetical protein